MEREALEEARDEAVTAQEKTDRLGRLTAEHDQASRKRASELAAREEQLALREQQVASREEAVGKREETCSPLRWTSAAKTMISSTAAPMFSTGRSRLCCARWMPI